MSLLDLFRNKAENAPSAHIMQNGATSSEELELRKVMLDEKRLAQEKCLKEREFELEKERLEQEKTLKDKELAIQKRGISPVSAAIFGGFIAIFGNIISGIYNTNVERQKQQGSLILEAVKTGAGKQKEGFSNLLFFSDAGLLNFTDEQKNLLKDKAKGVTGIYATNSGSALSSPAAPISRHTLPLSDWRLTPGACPEVPPKVYTKISRYTLDKTLVVDPGNSTLHIKVLRSLGNIVHAQKELPPPGTGSQEAIDEKEATAWQWDIPVASNQKEIAVRFFICIGTIGTRPATEEALPNGLETTYWFDNGG